MVTAPCLQSVIRKVVVMWHPLGTIHVSHSKIRQYTRRSSQMRGFRTDFYLFFLLRLFIQNLGLLGSAARRVEWSTHYACSRSQHALIMSEASMFLLLRNLTCGAFRAQFLFCRQLPVLLGCFSLGFNGPDLWSTFRQPLPSCSLKPVQ